MKLDYELRAQDPERATELGRAWGVSPFIAQVLIQRGLDSPERVRDFLDPKLKGLTSPDGMADRDAALERIAHAVKSRERIVVFGDYDVDGTTSAALLSLVLEALGADVVALVANRFEGGYGFSDPALARCLAAGAQLIITCDCGSSDHARISAARSKGVDVVVVDHHLVPAEPLPANAFLNPHRGECGFPYKGMSSAGLVFILGAGLRARLGATLDLRPYLDLVALGTIADVAPLDGDNRRLVRAGLAVLAGKDARPGITALRECANMQAGSIGAVDVAFRLAPRLNAAGRMGDPAVTLALLRARDLAHARKLAAEIEAINTERRAVERAVTDAAIAQVTEVYGPEPRTGVVLFGDGWHRGVVGISAARVVDHFGVPAIVIGVTNGVGHGSCRTPDDFDLYAAVARCRSELVAFGGHRAAAGVTVKQERLEAFRAAFADVSRRECAASPAMIADVAIGRVLPTARELFMLEPLGEANAEPTVVVQGAKVERASSVGEGGHLKLALSCSAGALSAFGYDLGVHAPNMPTFVDAIGHVRRDAWNGGDAVELRLLGFRPSA